MLKRFFPVFLFFLLAASVSASELQDNYFSMGQLKPIDSEIKVSIGDEAPDFSLPAIDGSTITLSDYRGSKNVMLSFIPAAWTAVCSDQWPGYNMARSIFDNLDTVVVGISVDNLPTLHSWIREMGEFWFPVVSDFWPHGKVAEEYGLLRSDGTAERAIIIIDKQGIIRMAHVEDINRRPELGMLINVLKEIG
ncbi:MAG: redoxin domain-containing protein [Desulfonatronovibrio sp.]